uniref:CP-type G domain-containing protein n=1 Tax=Picea sitchensis TaxID=3332 RepID=B8LMS1_PICSI|nr:unknown [Picea sitchensis]
MAVASTQRGLILRPPYSRSPSYHSPTFPTALRFPHPSSLETSFFAQQYSLKYSSLHPKTVNSRRPRCLNSSTETANKGSKIKEDAGELDLGPSAKSRGQIFLENALDKHDSAQSNTKEKRKKKKKKVPEMSTEPVCYGCGAPLQSVEVDGPGYVTLETYELKKKHRQLRSVLCGRCRLLSHGHMLTAVGGHGGYSGGKQFISAEQLREKLSHLRHDKALIVKLVDIVDFNGSFLARVRDLVGANPIIMVATKVDLLPKGTDLSVVGDWIVEATMRKKLNVLSIHLTSSKSLSGFVGVVSEIQQQRKGRDVYVLGSANVGKSAFINALLKTMALKDFVAAAARRYKPIQSAVPGTTLGPIQIDAFHGEGKLYDTPGVHLHHRQAAVVHAEDLPLLAPQSRLKGITISIDALTKENQELFYTSKTTSCTVDNGLNGLSIFWGGIVRIDVVKVPLHIRLIMYGPKGVQIKVVPTSEAEEFYHKELGGALKPPTGKDKAKNWPGLKGSHPIDVKMGNNSRPVCDIAISGLGWIAIEPGPSTNVTGAEDLDTLSTIDKQLHLLVHVAKPVEVFVRAPMPIGRLGSTWYEYSELTEEEEETRPKVSY